MRGNSRQRKTFLLFVAMLIAVGAYVCASAFAQSHSGFPIDIVAGPPPQPVLSNGHSWLVYELHLTNYVPWPITLKKIEIVGDTGTPIATYNGTALNQIVIPVEKLSSADAPPTSAENGQTIGEGRAVLIFFNVPLDQSAPAPNELRHRFSFSLTLKNGNTIERTVEGARVPVIQNPVPLLRPPLRGSAWIAFNALSSADHRRSLNAIDGRERIPERFAIDWMRLGPDSKLFHGDAKSNANFYGYGADVLAVADARVSAVKDDLPDNSGTTERDSRSITIDNAFGNYVILDLGQGRFAAYAHLQPHSIKVKVGDTVTAGHALALLGNSGNSDAPHLHFQATDANATMEAEGVPYELESFMQLGFVVDDAVLDHGEPWKATPADTPAVHRHEFPFDKAVISFP